MQSTGFGFGLRRNVVLRFSGAFKKRQVLNSSGSGSRETGSNASSRLVSSGLNVLRSWSRGSTQTQANPSYQGASQAPQPGQQSRPSQSAPSAAPRDTSPPAEPAARRKSKSVPAVRDAGATRKPRARVKTPSPAIMAEKSKKSFTYLKKLVKELYSSPFLSMLIAQAQSKGKYKINYGAILVAAKQYDFMDTNRNKRVVGLGFTTLSPDGSSGSIVEQGEESTSTNTKVSKGFDVQMHSLQGQSFFNYYSKLPELPCFVVLQLNPAPKMRVENISWASTSVDVLEEEEQAEGLEGDEGEEQDEE